MELSRAIYIFLNIESDDYTTEEKGLAIKTIIEKPTHNSFNKKQILKVLEWLFYQHFNI